MTTLAELDYAAEVLGDCIARLAEGKDDDELVPVGLALRELLDALDLSEAARTRCERQVTDLPNDGWMSAGELRTNARRYRAHLASGKAWDGVDLPGVIR